MKSHLNTLFVTSEGTYLSKQGEAVVVRPPADGRLVRVPLHMLHSIVCFGTIKVSPHLMALCAERDVSISYHTHTGRLLARVVGFTPGSVLLRREQFRASEDPGIATGLSVGFLQGKLHNSRVLVRRAIRDHGDARSRLGEVATQLRRSLGQLEHALSLHQLRGIEGEAAKVYLGCFRELIRSDEPSFGFETRSRRPPRDPVNAMLSFAYAMLASDVRSACESVGLDSQVGFLHVARAGRPALALDLMEELRPVIAERVVLSMINRGQVGRGDFVYEVGGAVQMKDGARKRLLVEYQRRKDETLRHSFLDEKVTLGLVPFIQARLLSRRLRGELDAYPPFLWK